MNPSRRSWPGAALILLTLACGEKPGEPEALPIPDRSAAAAPDAGRLLEEGYAFKREGRNGAALERFERACAVLERTVGPRDHLYASCLDDKAMVMLRLGRHAEARALYEDGRKVLERDPDPVLQQGVALRLSLLDRLDALGIRCAEPAEPAADDPLPYFPDVTKMQQALGWLGDRLRDCDEGRPRLVTMRITITGDGRPLLVETHGPDAGSPVGRCLQEKLMNLVGTADLPRFRACFRPFTYPFTVGDPPAR
jgi:tetratricopeptide (TPR) repeat protein